MSTNYPLVSGTVTPGSPSALYAMTGTWAALVAAHAATPFANETRLRCTDSIGFDVVVVSGVLQPQSPICNVAWSSRPTANLYPNGTLGLFTGIDRSAVAREFYVDNAANVWRPVCTLLTLDANTAMYIFANSSGWTYGQSGTTVTVTATSHGLSAEQNGAQIYLTQSAGALLTGWFTNFTYVDANTFTCTSTVSQTVAGGTALGANASETMCPRTYTIPAGLLKAGCLPNPSVYAKSKNNANTKTAKQYFGGVQIGTATLTVSSANWNSAANVNLLFLTSSTFIKLVSIDGSVNTSVGDTWTTGITLPTAGDWSIVIMFGIFFRDSA
jgi:hypothetical protein